MNEDTPIMVEKHERLGDMLGLDLLVVRDDLLPFPLAGNKVRKLERELRDVVSNQLLLTNGGVDSNHCRTLALWGARLGNPVHLVLHSEGTTSSASLAILTALGATFDVVQPDEVRECLDRIEASHIAKGLAVRRIAGGCHTKAGAIAYRDAGIEVIKQWQPDVLVVASGTGATQGGLVAAASGSQTRVLGISVARRHSRGVESVAEAAQWAGVSNSDVDFFDNFRDGGYGIYGDTTLNAVMTGWHYGLPLDPTYTGKAFSSLLDRDFRHEYLCGKRVAFWHTGGLFNMISAQSGTAPRNTGF